MEESGEAPVPPSWLQSQYDRPLLSDTGSNCADTLLAHELDADVCLVVGHLEISDQLSQVLDRVNVMMRRWRDQTDTGDGVTQLSNVFTNLMTGQLTTFAGLGA